MTIVRRKRFVAWLGTRNPAAYVTLSCESATSASYPPSFIAARRRRNVSCSVVLVSFIDASVDSLRDGALYIDTPSRATLPCPCPPCIKKRNELERAAQHAFHQHLFRRPRRSPACVRRQRGGRRSGRRRTDLGRESPVSA